MAAAHRFEPPSPPSSAVPALVAADPHRAAMFLRAQSSWLRRGLEAAEPTALGVVLGTHDASHAGWLALIAALQADEAAAGAVAALYGFHGRVVGFLERAPDHRLDPDVRSNVRCLLIARLHHLTDEAVARLLPGGPRGGADVTPHPA